MHPPQAASAQSELAIAVKAAADQAALVEESPGPGGTDQLVLDDDGTQTLHVDGPTLPCASPLSTQVLSITQ